MVENVEMTICRYHRLSAAAFAACIALVVSAPLQAASIALVAAEIGNLFRDTGVDIQSDNRLRSHNSGLQHIDGWLKFDFSAIPDTANITAMTLTLYGEGAFDVPFGSPSIQVRRASLDSWANGGTGFPASYQEVPTPVDNGPVPSVRHDPYLFNLNAGAADWGTDLFDDVLSLVLEQIQTTGIHRMYFYGPGGVSATGDANSQGAVFDFAPRLEVTFDTTTVPVPAALPLFLSALMGMGLIAGRRRRRRIA